MAKTRDLPKNMADSFDDQVKAFHGFLVEQRKEFRKRTGDRPFGGEPVSQDQKMIQISQMEAQDWANTFKKHGRAKDDGRLLLPNKMISQAKEIQTLIKRGEFNI